MEENMDKHFHQATEYVKTNAKNVAADILLKLYARFKQVKHIRFIPCTRLAKRIVKVMCFRDMLTCSRFSP